MKLKQLLQEKRENILKIAAQHGAFNIHYFLVQLPKGEETQDSDIDL